MRDKLRQVGLGIHNPFFYVDLQLEPEALVSDIQVPNRSHGGSSLGIELDHKGQRHLVVGKGATSLFNLSRRRQTGNEFVGQVMIKDFSPSPKRLIRPTAPKESKGEISVGRGQITPVLPNQSVEFETLGFTARYTPDDPLRKWQR